MIRYYVCGLGYDVNDNITDYVKEFGDFDTYEEAYEKFVKLQCAGTDVLFVDAIWVNQLLLQVEECEEDDNFIDCIDVKNEWWITNPNYKGDN